MSLQPVRILGIDFSGAIDAGKKIWIAEGTHRDNILAIQRCERATAWIGQSSAREDIIAALREWIATQVNAAFGLDFPFGLPQPLVGDAHTWEEFIRHFPNRYRTAANFYAQCVQASSGRELRRHCDREAKVPWSPYNLRLYRQSYHGMANLLAPLVARKAVCVLPMQPAEPGKPWLLEVCPASTLTRLGLRWPYKRPGEAGHATRARILSALEARSGLLIVNPAVRAAALSDSQGDALDSIVAALAAWRAVRDPFALFPPDPLGVYAIEGYVYV